MDLSSSSTAASPGRAAEGGASSSAWAEIPSRKSGFRRGPRGFAEPIPKPSGVARVSDEVENGPDGGGERMAALVQDWIESREMLVQSGALAAGTCRKDKVRAKTISAWFGQAKVADVGPDDVMRFYAAMRTGSSSLSGEPLSGTTARGIAVALSAVMDMAVKRRIILENPCSGVDKPKVDTDEKQALSVETLRLAHGRARGRGAGSPEDRRFAGRDVRAVSRGAAGSVVEGCVGRGSIDLEGAQRR